MWYYDPFIMLPVLWGSISVLAFGAMVLVAKRGYKWTGRILAAVFAASASAAGFALAFGWLLNNPEEVEVFETWIGIIL